jgi:hypothetical protein
MSKVNPESNNNAPPPLLMPIITHQTYIELNITDKNDIKFYGEKLSEIYYKVLTKHEEILQVQNNFDEIFLKIFVKPIIRSLKSLKNTSRNIDDEILYKISDYIFLRIMNQIKSINSINQNLNKIINPKKF